MGCSSGKAAGGAPGGSSSSSSNKTPRKEEPFDPSTIILDNPSRIQNFYSAEQNITESLGVGLPSVWSKVRNKNSNAVRALKTLAKAQMNSRSPELVRQEISILNKLDHPNIVKLFETYEDHRNVYLVTELCTGGELFDRIIRAGRLSEPQAASLMEQVIGAVGYMHEKKVVHRDLKPDSFMLVGQEPLEKGQLKLVDFGQARTFKTSQVLTTKAGSTYYVSPQVLAGKYNHMCDLWSCGVIAYLMLCGYPPFFGETEAEVLNKVKLGNFTFKPMDWKGVSDEAKTLIRGLLKMSPRDRWPAEQALQHGWIKNRAPKAPMAALPANFVDNLRSFRSHNRLKKAALHVIAGQMNGDQIEGLREVFQALDTNGDGLLTGSELKQALLKANLEELPADLQQIVDDVDADDSGIVDYTEFLAATLDQHLYMQEDILWSAFRLFDRNGDGKISQDEIKYVLHSSDVNKRVGSSSIEDIMSEVDTNGDGVIDFQEFRAMMHQKSS